MPTKHVTAEVMDESGGKHWTRAQKDARREAADLAKRKNKRSINAPASLSTAWKAVWNRVMKSVEGIDLLDNMDTELLEAYCEAVAQSRDLKKKVMSLDDIKAYQAYLRIIKSLADSLGLSPAARARLVKKKADEIEDTFGKKFD